jgi:hypothetical protein
VGGRVVTTKQIEDTLKQLDKTLRGNAGRPVATRPLADGGKCTHPGCKKCKR